MRQLRSRRRFLQRLTAVSLPAAGWDHRNRHAAARSNDAHQTTTGCPPEPQSTTLLEGATETTPETTTPEYRQITIRLAETTLEAIANQVVVPFSELDAEAQTVIENAVATDSTRYPAMVLNQETYVEYDGTYFLVQQDRIEERSVRGHGFTVRAISACNPSEAVRRRAAENAIPYGELPPEDQEVFIQAGEQDAFARGGVLRVLSNPRLREPGCRRAVCANLYRTGLRRV